MNSWFFGVLNCLLRQNRKSSVTLQCTQVAKFTKWKAADNTCLTGYQAVCFEICSIKLNTVKKKSEIRLIFLNWFLIYLKVLLRIMQFFQLGQWMVKLALSIYVKMKMVYYFKRLKILQMDPCWFHVCSYVIFILILAFYDVINSFIITKVQLMCWN